MSKYWYFNKNFIKPGKFNNVTFPCEENFSLPLTKLVVFFN
jgi:hypothetical protein